MPPWAEMFIAIIVAAVGSSGLWNYINKRQERKSASHRLLTALAHDRIVDLCHEYLDREWITTDEFENLHDYLYASYVEMGGNGTAKRLMKEVEKLPTREPRYKEVTK